MKGNYKFLLIALLIAFASCSFTSKTLENTDKDKRLLELITHVLNQGHLSPQEINDDFSKHVFDDYINQLDPFKRYFYHSDIKEFEAYRDKIDDQIKTYDLSFFNITNQRYLQRVEESKALFEAILSQPFDYTISEEFNTDYDAFQYVKNKGEMKERWRKQLKFSTISYYDEALENRDLASTEDSDTEVFSGQDTNEKLSELPKSDADIEREARETTLRFLQDMYSYQKDRTRSDWFAIYMNAIVSEFDPHTSYYAPEDKERFDMAMSGKFEGIGARLQKRMDIISVSEIISGGPAWRQNKLQPGDQILKVRQEDEQEAVSIVGMRIEDAVKYIKGPKDTKVILSVKKVDGALEDIVITRDVVEIEDNYAKSAKVNHGEQTFGVINLPSFYVDFSDYKSKNAATDVKKEIEKLKAEGVEGLVLDLRGNGGGSLQTVVDMAGLFIEEGPIVQVKSTIEAKRVLKDRDPSIVWDGPLVILVNELSASASEILAAAMQDYKRAIIIGSEQTFGKGTVQNVMDLNRMVRNNSSGDLGALKFTTDKYYRINGGSTQLKGVTSDIIVPDRYKYIGIGERTQDNPLAWDKIDATNFTPWQNYYDYDAAIENSRRRMADNSQLKLIDENAKWINDIRENNTYSLNYEDYKNELNKNEEYAKRFDQITEYKTNLTFESLTHEMALFEKDSVLKQKRQRWHSNLSKDVYIEEAMNVLRDLKLSRPVEKNIASDMKN